MTEFEKRKIEFAKYCWRRRSFTVPGKRYTWAQRFEQIHGENLYDYRSRVSDNAQESK